MNLPRNKGVVACINRFICYCSVNLGLVLMVAMA